MILALFQRSLISQKPAPITDLPRASNRYAILIGVGSYLDGNITPLTDPGQDVQAIRRALEEFAGFHPDNITVLSTDLPDSEKPTRANILFSLSKVRNSISGDSLLLFMFAGHGIERNNKAFLMPNDARLTSDVGLLAETSLSVDVIRQLIASTGVKQTIVFLDSCRNDPLAGHDLSNDKLTPSFRTEFDFDRQNKEIEASAVVYATSVGGRAYVDGSKKLGYFTEVLVEGLGGAAADSAGRVTLSGLMDYLQTKVPELVDKDLHLNQKPFYAIAGYKPSDLVLSAVRSTSGQVGIGLAQKTEASRANSAPDPDSLLAAGNGASKAGDFQNAIQNLTKAIEVRPDWADAYNARAAVYDQNGALQLALQDYSMAVKLNPKWSSPIFYKGRVEERLSDPVAAASDYDRAIQLSPEWSSPYFSRAGLFEKDRRYDKAAEYYERACTLSPNWGDACSGRDRAKAERDVQVPPVAQNGAAVGTTYRYSFTRGTLNCVGEYVKVSTTEWNERPSSDSVLGCLTDAMVLKYTERESSDRQYFLLYDEGRRLLTRLSDTEKDQVSSVDWKLLTDDTWKSAHLVKRLK